MKNAYFFISGITIFLFAACGAVKKDGHSLSELEKPIEELMASHRGIIGISILQLESGDEISFHTETKYPMQSVYKFPLALAILNDVQNGKLKLNQTIHLTPDDVARPTWSKLREMHPKGNADVSIKDLLYYTVSLSDNIACDLLFQATGGTAKVNDYIHGIGIKDIQIVATEREMHSDGKVQFGNWCHPQAYTQMLKGLYEKKYLNDSLNALLMKFMTETFNSPSRIRGYLPDSIKVAHKTGTSGTSDSGISAATNDVGIITLPNGRHVAIAAFVTNSPEPIEADEKIIALISKTVYEFYLGKELTWFKYESWENEKGDTLPLRWLAPVDENPTAKYPLIIYLHGNSARGNDYEAALSSLPQAFTDSALRKKHKAYILVPQCPKNDVWVKFPGFPASLRTTDYPTNSAAMVLECIQDWIRNKNIDSARIYITGFSMGGEGTMDLISRKPELFACAVPVASVSDTSKIQIIKNIPVWFFHGGSDKINSVQYAEMEYLKLKAAGGKTELTVYPEFGHDVRKSAYANQEMWDWMFLQNKKNESH